MIMDEDDNYLTKEIVIITVFAAAQYYSYHFNKIKLWRSILSGYIYV